MKKSTEKIIQALALAGIPLTPYGIAKASGLSVSIVHKEIKDLERKNVAKMYAKEEWRTGLEKHEFILTFKGVVDSLALACSTKVKKSEIKKIVENFSMLYPDYPLFTGHEFLAQQLGDRVYDWYASTARILKIRPLHSAVARRSVHEWAPGAKGIALESAKKGQRVLVYRLTVPLPREKEDGALMHEYALAFLGAIEESEKQEGRLVSLNEALRTFFEKTLVNEVEALRQMLGELEKRHARLKVHGGARA